MVVESLSEEGGGDRGRYYRVRSGEEGSKKTL